eukprot:10004351-Prorocentrum_lima.AAC.1
MNRAAAELEVARRSGRYAHTPCGTVSYPLSAATLNGDLAFDGTAGVVAKDEQRQGVHTKPT